jgi:ABC-type Mn2+/Zn2+ transport system ATPase subunit
MIAAHDTWSKATAYQLVALRQGVSQVSNNSAVAPDEASREGRSGVPAVGAPIASAGDANERSTLVAAEVAFECDVSASCAFLTLAGHRSYPRQGATRSALPVPLGEAMEAALHNQILERLFADEALDTLVVDLVDAACQGAPKLEQVLGGTRIERLPPPALPESAEVREPPGAYLDTITVAGFRGVGPEATLSIPHGPGLTLVVGRNGSGKSTFAEALETLLTGESGRWSAARSKLWKQGWRNLHAEGPARVQATLLVEGRAPLRMTRRWEGAELAQSTISLDGAESLDALGWVSALTAFRPFISHPELGVLASEPSQAFDQLREVLGLGEVTEALGLLTSQRKALEVRAKAVKDRRPELLEQAQALSPSDARAERIEVLLRKRKVPLDDLEADVLGESDGGRPDSEHRLLRTLSSLRLPTLEEWQAAAAALRSAVAEFDAAAVDSAADHSALAQLLEAALPFVKTHPATCPVCAQPAAADLASKMGERMQWARERSARFAQCQRALTEAQRSARALIERLPQSDLAAADRAGFVEGASDRVSALRAALQNDARPLADQLETVGLELAEAGDRLRKQAEERLRALDDTFKPLQRELVTWLSDARREEQVAPRLDALKAAEKWLQQQEGDLRDERFLPIADQVKEVWRLLGQQSSVALDSVKLVGKGTQRRLDLGVSVEGAGAAAVGVMSQGELNALALSLFLPRMMLAESPFRFLVIDDPVQAMDPLKVDGLARVLQSVAKKRQVVVFTHDPRLVEAVQRLQIPATVQEVTRRVRSTVEVRVTGNATAQYLSDARHVARTASAMGDKLVRRVVPGFCRSAVEATCLQVVRRRRLGRGDRHDEVEDQLQPTNNLLELVSLALFDTPDKAGDVLRHLSRANGPRGGADTVQAVKAGAHGHYTGNPMDLVRATEILTEYLVAQR